MVSLADDLLMGASAIASWSGLSQREVYYLVEHGKLPVVRKGRKIFARKSELAKSFSAMAIAAE